MNGVKILGIAASARRRGNSELLLDRLLEGARSKNALTEKILLHKLNITPCGAGGHCTKTGACHIKDDMELMYKKLKEADAVVVASPVYFGSIPGELKVMVDRCQAVWADNFIIKRRRPKPARNGVFISVSSHSNKRFFDNSREIIKIFFMVFGIRLFKHMYVPGMEDRGAVLAKKALLAKAYRLGEELAGWRQEDSMK
jgi:multimeric flavodoxin WrbA